MSKAEQANLWKMVDEYATVDALQEFCGTKLNLQRRAWRAVGTCVEGRRSLKHVFSTFRTKKAEYLKAWETLHGEPEHKKAGVRALQGEARRVLQDHERADRRGGQRVPQLLLLLKRWRLAPSRRAWSRRSTSAGWPRASPRARPRPPAGVAKMP